LILYCSELVLIEGLIWGHRSPFCEYDTVALVEQSELFDCDPMSIQTNWLAGIVMASHYNSNPFTADVRLMAFVIQPACLLELLVFVCLMVVFVLFFL